MNGKQLTICSLSAVVALLILAGFLFPSISWDGQVNRTTTITVLDDRTNTPVVGANVRLLRNIETELLAQLNEPDRSKQLQSFPGYGFTDTTGTVVLSRRCPAGGGRIGPFRTGHFRMEGPITVEAAGYKTFSSSLQDYLGKKRFPLSKKEFSITVYIGRASNNRVDHISEVQ